MNVQSHPGPAPGAPSASLSESLRSDLSALYALTQSSRHVFASPLGPLPAGGRPLYLPRFVFFGPHACDDSWRLAFLAGLDHDDLRSSRALVALATRLASDSETGHALNLSFFPVVDVTGLLTGKSGRGLADSPEIGLLAGDARQRGYHGFVRIETRDGGEDEILLRVRRPFGQSADPDFISPEETRGLPVRIETEDGEGGVLPSAGLPFAPFELTLCIPAFWSDEAYQHAAVTFVERFLRRYRAFQAYGLHL